MYIRNFEYMEFKQRDLRVVRELIYNNIILCRRGSIIKCMLNTYMCMLYTSVQLANVNPLGIVFYLLYMYVYSNFNE
jgi:hypothetical protein